MPNIPLHILIISPVPPYPPRSGGTHHLYSMLKTLARHCRITLCVISPNPTDIDWGDLPALSISCHAFPQTPNTYAFWLPPFSRAFHSHHLVRFLAQICTEDPPDIVQIEFSGLAHLVDALPSHIPTISTLYNVDTRALRSRLPHTHPWWRRLRRWLGIALVAAYEHHYLRRFRHLVTLSPADTDFIAQHWHIASVTTIPTGITLPDVPPPLPAQPHILFVGNGHHQPNRDGLDWFLRHCWPHIRAQLPTCQLHLVGDALPTIADTHIITHGMVADVAPHYHHARVVIAPIWWGGGVRIKILEAMAFARPLVATAAACDGLALTSDHVRIANDASTYVTAVVDLCNDTAQAGTLATAAHAWVESYTWPNIIHQYLDLYTTLLQQPPNTSTGARQ